MINLAITVGLEQTMFTSEEGTLVEVCTIVLAGMLQRNAIVTLRTIEDTATCKSELRQHSNAHLIVLLDKCNALCGASLS